MIVGNQYSNAGVAYSKFLTNQYSYDPGKRYLDAVFESLLSATEHVYFNLVPGSIAEFGTGFGLTANYLSYACKVVGNASGGDLRDLFLFDSFEGLPEIRTDADKQTSWRKGDFKGATPDELIKTCKDYLPEEKIHIYRGWFSDSLLNLPTDTKFALLHVDCDLYESTRDVLIDLFSNSRISPGAVLCFDDFNCHRADPKMGERKAFNECVERFNIKFSIVGPYSPFGWKCIVHDYGDIDRLSKITL